MQGGNCPLTGRALIDGEAVADHDHKTGHMRMVLDRRANAMLGKLENAWSINGFDEFSPAELKRVLSRFIDYKLADYSMNPRHYTHRNEDERRLRKNLMARRLRHKRKTK